MSSPTNLIQYLFGKDVAGGDRGSVRDKLEKQKRLENQTLDQSLINIGISTDDSEKIDPLDLLDKYNNELFRQKFIGGNTSDLEALRAMQPNKDLIKERFTQQRSPMSTSTIGGKPIINRDFQQLQARVAPEDFTFVPNSDQSVVNEALRVGKRVADASNEEKRINIY